MKHRKARQIFEEIQGRPYRVAVAPDIVANNCYYKGQELLQRLALLGYAVRGRVCETFWDPQVFPQDIVDLHPDDILSTHFYVEVLVDDEWRIIDPSFQPALAQYGFTIGSWEGTPTPCFPAVKIYSDVEMAQYQRLWRSPGYMENYFQRCQDFLSRMNAWLEKLDATSG